MLILSDLEGVQQGKPRNTEEQEQLMQKITREQFEESKRIVQSKGKEGRCPIWPDSPARVLRTSEDPALFHQYWSPRGGGVFKTLSPCADLASDENIRKRVSSWIWERNAAFDALGAEEKEEMPELTPELIQTIADRQPLTTEQRIDRALRAIGRPPNRIGPKSIGAQLKPEQIEDLQRFQAATECGDDNEMRWLIRELGATELIREVNPGAAVPSYSLTLNGLKRLETGGDALVSKTAFVAMWFNDEVTSAYEKGIGPAVREAGYEPMRIDRKEHSNRIDDEIVAEIRRARFLVCDFTCGLLPDNAAKSGETAIARGGVYYEAGFAHGLGKKVIWTCRSDLIDHVHFDLRQYNTILWEDGKEDKFRQALLNRIRAEIAT